MDGKGLGLLRKGLLSALVIGVFGGAVSLGVFGAFSATTQNAGNQIVSGTVNVADNDNGSAVYNATGMRPGEAVTRCVRVTYTGNLAATMRLYSGGTPGPLAPFVDLTITAGTQASPSFPSCTGFTADSGGQLFTGTLEQFQLNRGNYVNGLTTTPGAASAWNQNDARVYRIVAMLRADAPNSVQGTSTGSHSFIWEARNN